MSYDLMVFEPGAAPREREAFLASYRRQTMWTEPHRYDDPQATSPGLATWFDDMLRFYPP